MLSDNTSLMDEGAWEDGRSGSTPVLPQYTSPGSEPWEGEPATVGAAAGAGAGDACWAEARAEANRLATKKTGAIKRMKKASKNEKGADYRVEIVL
jgi:hypothetical protein